MSANKKAPRDFFLGRVMLKDAGNFEPPEAPETTPGPSPEPPPLIESISEPVEALPEPAKAKPEPAKVAKVKPAARKELFACGTSRSHSRRW